MNKSVTKKANTRSEQQRAQETKAIKSNGDSGEINRAIVNLTSKNRLVYNLIYNDSYKSKVLRVISIKSEQGEPCV